MAAKLQPFTALSERRQAAAGRLFASGQVVLSLNSNGPPYKSQTNHYTSLHDSILRIIQSILYYLLFTLQIPPPIQKTLSPVLLQMKGSFIY